MTITALNICMSVTASTTFMNIRASNVNDQCWAHPWAGAAHPLGRSPHFNSLQIPRSHDNFEAIPFHIWLCFATSATQKLLHTSSSRPPSGATLSYVAALLSGLQASPEIPLPTIRNHASIRFYKPSGRCSFALPCRPTANYYEGGHQARILCRPAERVLTQCAWIA